MIAYTSAWSLTLLYGRLHFRITASLPYDRFHFNMAAFTSA